jgi:nucleoid DNA-binding protein
MRKYDLVTIVSKKTGIIQVDVDTVINTAFQLIRRSVGEGQIVRIKSFGVFAPRTRPAKIARNLQGGKRNPEPLYLPPCTIAAFKPSKNFFHGSSA